MKTLFLIFFSAVLLGIGVAYAQVAYRASEGYMPDVIVVQRKVPDTARICVEPIGSGLLSCRPVGELRKWVLETKLK